MKKALKNIFYCIAKALLIICGKVFFRLKSSGNRQIPRNGGVLIVANHASNLDPFLIGCQIKRQVRFFTKKEAFRISFVAWILKFIGCIPVNRKAIDIGALKTAIQVLKNGNSLMFFPEGTRTHDGRMGSFKPGVAKIACESKAMIVPTYIKGSYDAWPRHRKFFKPVRIQITFGMPFEAKEIIQTSLNITDRKKTEVYRELTTFIENKVKELKKKNGVQ